MKARDIMTSPVITVAPETTVKEVATLLYECRIGALPVVQDGSVVGIVSESDLLRRHEIGTDRFERAGSWWLCLFGTDGSLHDYVRSHARFARDVMTRGVVTVTPDTSLAETAQLLEGRRIGRVPVVDAGKLIGIVSRANLVQALAARAPAPAEPQAVDDESIRRALLEELERQTWWRIDRAAVLVTNGVVQFQGMVDTDAGRPAARVAAENIPGVRAVEDHRFLSSNAPTMT
ncbi:MAG: CBS domain-containing protein [Burkholderiales bacterium]